MFDPKLSEALSLDTKRRTTINTLAGAAAGAWLDLGRC